MVRAAVYVTTDSYKPALRASLAPTAQSDRRMIKQLMVARLQISWLHVGLSSIFQNPT